MTISSGIKIEIVLTKSSQKNNRFFFQNSGKTTHYWQYYVFYFLASLHTKIVTVEMFGMFCLILFYFFGGDGFVFDFDEILDFTTNYIFGQLT